MGPTRAIGRLRPAALGGLVALILGMSAARLCAESVTFTTYYPVPSGAYKYLNVTQQVTASSMSVTGTLNAITGQVFLPQASQPANSTCLASQVGSIRYNTQINKLEYCRGGTSPPIWTGFP